MDDEYIETFTLEEQINNDIEYISDIVFIISPIQNWIICVKLYIMSLLYNARVIFIIYTYLVVYKYLDYLCKQIM